MIKYIHDNCQSTDMVGVEIGVWEGMNAKSILDNLSMKTLYLVDPYDTYTEDGKTRDRVGLRIKKNMMKRTLNGYKDKIVNIYEPSDIAIDRIPDNLDFVYIDGNHTYEYVKKDIELYYPKVML